MFKTTLFPLNIFICCTRSSPNEEQTLYFEPPVQKIFPHHWSPNPNRDS